MFLSHLRISVIVGSSPTAVTQIIYLDNKNILLRLLIHFDIVSVLVHIATYDTHFFFLLPYLSFHVIFVFIVNY